MHAPDTRTRTAATAARPAAAALSAALAGALFVLTPLAVATAPGPCLAAVAVLVATPALRLLAPPRTLRAAAARVTRG
ncbi:hypothetical protein [Halosegnis marinus]|uniref:Uncharacterized protein n=1 Tax=Halosegnis marinus TaxID=3034023 RepID=A0ABD5ZSB0_9EURY|nr:hypothetical protein [Halosegnis sp. DT85]